MEFTWDEAKARSNLRKHGVTFEEAETVFGDPFEITVPAAPAEEPEERWLSIGETSARRLIVVCYTERGAYIRIISARPATRRERAAYERRRPPERRR